jgi:hypothetical protein
MGESSEGRAASVSFDDDDETDDPASGEANHVTSRSQKDRGVPTGEVGEAEGGAEEGGVDREACC